MTEATKKFITMSLWVALFIFALRSLIGWAELVEIRNNEKLFKGCYTLFGYAGEAISGAAIFMAAFNKLLWRWKPLNKIAGGMPVLGKSYKGKIRFFSDETIQERIIEVNIEQTFLDITVKLNTDESYSMSTTASIENNQLIYTYINNPRGEIQNKSSIHYGTAILILDDPKHLSGNYFTSRQSKGSMDLFENK